MKATRAFVLLAMVLLSSCAAPPSADALSAAKAHDWFVFLETGRKTPDDRARVADMQRGHIENFKRLFADKKLFAAGPLRDPAGVKRGIVVVQAPDADTLRSYFTPDEYVREGYMVLNAVPVTVVKPLATEGIDPNAIEEVRIVQIMRGPEADPASSHAYLRALVDRGVFGAWYVLATGPTADILFSRERGEDALRTALADHPAVRRGAEVRIWAQWLGKGVVR